MKIGFDLDHTLFNYTISMRKALDSHEKYSKLSFSSKAELKQNMCDLLGPRAWTEFQGILYCDFLEFVFIDPFAIKLIQLIKAKGHHFVIVSHKTTRPISGGDCLLRTASDSKLKREFSLGGIPYTSSLPVKYYDSLSQKISAIQELEFDFFIDDLPEVIESLKGKVNTLIHFDENIEESKSMKDYLAFKSWFDIHDFFAKDNVL